MAKLELLSLREFASLFQEKYVCVIYPLYYVAIANDVQYWIRDAFCSFVPLIISNGVQWTFMSDAIPSLFWGSSWPWSYDNWIYNYLCNQCLTPLMLWVRISIRARCTTLCDKVCQWLATGRCFFPGPPGSSNNKTDRHDITEILLKVTLNTTKQTNKQTLLLPTKCNKWCVLFLCTFDYFKRCLMNLHWSCNLLIIL